MSEETLTEKAARLARELSAEGEARAAEHAGDYDGEPVVPEPAVPIAAPVSGFVDLVFYQGQLESIRDPRGVETQVGNWLDIGDRRVLRLPWVPGGVSSDDDVDETTGRPSFKEQPRKMRYPNPGTAAAQILAAFIADWRNGLPGLIDKDVAARTDLPLGTVNNKRGKLVTEGWLRPTGRKVRTTRDRESTQWEISPAAIDALNLTRGG